MLRPAWQLLLEKHPDRPVCQKKQYSPTAINRRSTHLVPGFLSEEDELFERDLSEAAPSGFFRQSPFAYSPLAPRPPAPAAKDELGRKMRESAARIKDMLSEDMRERGVPDVMIGRYFEYSSEENEAIEERRWSYAGWAVTCSEFQRELDFVRSQAKKPGDQVRLPELPITFLGGQCLTGVHQDDDLWQIFLQKWGLESLATWDLPVPMRPELAEPSFYSLPDIRSAGLTLFIPWYLLRDKNVSLHDLANRQILLQLPPPLKDWLDPKPKNWGHKRYSMMLSLYVYLELGLKRRYADRIRGNLTSLDKAFAEFLISRKENLRQSPDESIRKIRLEMMRRIQGK